MRRKVLLVEPNYKNKYPPMSLMKLSTYYKSIGDEVTFFKGNLIDLVLDDIFEMLLKQLYANDKSIFWESYKPQIIEYIRKGTEKLLSDIPCSDSNPIIKDLFKYYRKYYYRKYYFDNEFKKYDKVCVTTLFTFYWDITIETINFVKKLCKNEKDVIVGGVMATILSDKVEMATGIKPHVGLLDKPGQLDKDNNIIIDTLPLDYSILEEIEYEYPAKNAYFAYMTRGCINKCPFCAVPRIEPNYREFMPVSEQVKFASEKFGEKKDLLLLDNNVLASRKLGEIVEDIKLAGFSKNDTFVEPNRYEIAIKNLKSGYNDKGYVKTCVREFRKLITKNKIKDLQQAYNLLRDNNLLEYHTARKEVILEIYDKLKPYFEDLYSKSKKKRFVDFNQGIDARLINNDNMAKLAEIPLKPVRIAFDHWSLHEIYEKAVICAVNNGHKNLSNYILYNFDDKPIELYKRLKLNIDLCEKLGASIYSFPMKYHPIEDPKYFSNRDYIGKYWNRKFIRTIQAILNSTKGKVGRGYDFFCKAFGRNEEEFFKLLYMPEAMIIYRLYFEKIGLTSKWWNDFNCLTDEQKIVIKPIIEKNKFDDYEKLDLDKDVLKVLEYYRITRNDAEINIKSI